MMRLRALIMIEFLDNDWNHQINSIKMIHRQIKMCEWSQHVLYRRADHMTSFEYNSSRMIIIFATVLSLIHGSRLLDIMSSHTSWHDHDSFVSIVELFENHVRLLRRSWIDEKRHLRYRTDSKIDETTKKKWSERWDNVQSINKKLEIMRRSSACRTHNCRILMNWRKNELLTTVCLI
jgi:hypothetical protein